MSFPKPPLISYPTEQLTLVRPLTPFSTSLPHLPHSRFFFFLFFFFSVKYSFYLLNARHFTQAGPARGGLGARVFIPVGVD
jgi:hypothetical protein